jgi:copper chaperone
MTETITYEVPGVNCANCEAAIKQAISPIEGVDQIHVDLETKKVVVRGAALDDAELRAAIDGAGYDVA